MPLNGISLYAKWTLLEYEITNNKVTILSYPGNDTSITIPDKICGYPVTTIADNAFKDNTLLESVILGRYVTTIGNSAFSNMVNLKSISFPNSAQIIGTNVLYGSNNISQLTISSELDYELKYFFGNNFYFIPETLQNVKFATGASYINKTMLNGYWGSVTLEFASDQTQIENNLFEGNLTLRRIVIPASVTRIGNYAFNNAVSLSTVIFAENSQLRTIGYQAFHGASSLANIVLPASVTYIGDYAFSYTSSLTKIVIPQAVTGIGIDAFGNGNQITIYVEAFGVSRDWTYGWDSTYSTVFWGFREWLEYENANYALLKNNTAILDSVSPEMTSTDMVIPSYVSLYKVTHIAPTAFSTVRNITSIFIPASVISIGNSAFSDLSFLTEVTFAENSELTYIGEYAFFGAFALRSLVIPEGVTSIGNSAFEDTLSLTSIVIPEGVTSIGNSAFKCAESLKSIVIPASVTSIGDCAPYQVLHLQNIRK